MTGCYSNGIWRCRWGCFFNSSQLWDTCTQTCSHVHTKHRGHLLYDTVLFSVCFTLKWAPPAGYCFTFVTHSQLSQCLHYIHLFHPNVRAHTLLYSLICNETHKDTHTITARRLAAQLKVTRRKRMGELLFTTTPKEEKKKCRGGREKKQKQAVVWELFVKCKAVGDLREGRGVRRRSWEVKVGLHSKGDVLVQASSCDLLTSLQSVNHKHSLVKRKWMSFRHKGVVIWGCRWIAHEGCAAASPAKNTRIHWSTEED